MKPRLTQLARIGLYLFALAIFSGTSAAAAPYAAYVVDARSGEVLFAHNADTRLHPASLTKMMTLYIAFQAVEHGELTMDTLITVDKAAAAEPPSKLGLRTGTRIKFRYLIRAAAVKSANDAATQIGIAIAGSPDAFAARMTRTAKAMGMNSTTFKNAHGLTQDGHLSTARDMTILGRHLFFDYPEYYNLFSRITTDAGMREVANTNRRFLNAYKGSDGIKTGYTRAAGFNLVASAERGDKRIIATMFGGRSTAQRNAKVAELLDMGFERAPRHAKLRKTSKPAYSLALTGGVVTSAIRAPESSPLPRARPVAAPPEELLVAMAATIEETVSAVETGPAAISEGGLPLPKPRPASLTIAASTPGIGEKRVVVERLSTSGDRHWGINIGRYASSYQAERVLLQTALTELGTLDEALRKVKHGARGFEAIFVGMTQDNADLACRRLTARNITCETFGPS